MPLASIAAFLKQAFREPEVVTAANRQEALRTATAAVLLEISYADNAMSLPEERELLHFLEQRFDLPEDRARELLETAEGLRRGTIDHWALTNMIRHSTSVDERIELVKTMWRIIYSDGQLHQYEDYLVRKLSDLLGLEHHVMIDAKVSVRKEIGAG